MEKLRLAVLISGRGSNLQALIDACRAPQFPAEIAVVISNTQDAQGLARADEAGLPAMIVDHNYFKGDKPAFENALASIVEQYQADLVCLAGFMRILGSTFLNRFKDKVINIHPSLLPKHPGLNVHESVLGSGDKLSGCSVHIVTAGTDEGPVIAQREVKVKKGDTPESLAARVLAEEHILYPDVVRKIAEGKIRIIEGRIESDTSVRHHGHPKSEPEVTLAHSPTPHHDAPHHVADAAAVERAQYMWNAFTKGSMIAGAAVAITLIFMAVFLA